MKLLVTGGCGFIGSHFIRLALSRGAEVYNIDKMTYAGKFENTKDFDGHKNYKFMFCDINDLDLIGYESLMPKIDFDAIINFAAESHVDRSISNPVDFSKTNFMGVATLLEVARTMMRSFPTFLQVSTDEVYGDLPLDDSPGFTEESPIRPSSPYSAAKAGADHLVLSYWRTYKYPVIVTRCSNNYGPNQDPEKLIPSVVTKALSDQPIPVYGNGLNVRDWIYVKDHCEGIWAALTFGNPGEVYNFGAYNELTNIEIVKRILRLLDKPESLITFVKDRKGHDRRYAINSEKARNDLFWTPTTTFSGGLAETIKWYATN